jgi:6,7-dimethyl-8-ribityllumazine synthase
MMTMIKGMYDAQPYRFGIVVARFNDFITSSLLRGAQEALAQHGANPENTTVIWVPGAFEMPLVAQRLVKSERVDAVIALGAVIRGATPHFDYVCSTVSSALSALAQTSDTPIIFGVLTTNTIEQAIERAGTKAGNKGWEAACSAIEMASVCAQMTHNRMRHDLS